MTDHSQHDKTRTKELYAYLIGTLARAHQGGRNTIKRMFGGERRFYDKLRTASGAITTGELVSRLADFRQYCQQHTHTYLDEENLPPLLTTQDIRSAFLKLIELTPEERQQLGLSHNDTTILAQQALLQIWNNQDQHSYERVQHLYNTAVSNTTLLDHPLQGYSDAELRDVVKAIARDHLSTGDFESLDAHTSSNIDQIIKQYKIIEISIHEINQIILKTGVQQIRLTNIQGKDSYCNRYLPQGFIRRLIHSVIDNQILTSEFPIFIDSVSLEKCGPFPLSISRSYQSSETDRTNKIDLSSSRVSLNSDLLDLKRHELLPFSKSNLSDSEIDFSQVASQHNFRVKVDFHIKIKKGLLHHSFPEAYEQLKEKSTDRHDFIHFSLESTGFGGVLSHITKLINNAVLTDICINLAAEIDSSEKQKSSLDIDLRKQYFPIAHDVILNQQFPRNTVASPIWAHSVVMLCKTKYLAHAMDQSRIQGRIIPYTDVSFNDQVARGSYCGFDLLLCQAKAALNSRLAAIKQTGIAAEDYVQALYNRVERQYYLEKASMCVNAYPFSSLAQEGLLNQTLLQGVDRPLTEDDPYLLFTACLRIAESFLTEGAYRKAWPYLDRVSKVLFRSTRWYDYFDEPNKPTRDFRIFSGSLVIRFTLCLAHYFMSVDPDQESQSISDKGRSQFLPSHIAWEGDRAITWYRDPQALQRSLIERSWEALEAAEKHLNIRLSKYFVIGEESQGTFYPHYKHLSQIYALRARLFLYFSKFVPLDPRFYRPPTDQRKPEKTKQGSTIIANILYLFEISRLHSAADGDRKGYICYTAYQCYAYIMSAYLPEGVSIVTRDGTKLKNLSKSDCLNWAYRLRNDALISYEDIGRKCYLELKAKSGVSETLLQQRQIKRANFGLYQVDGIPVIRETFEEGGSRIVSNGDTKILELDMSILSVDKEHLSLSIKENNRGTIYLFGPMSCYLFFVRGIYCLAGPHWNEFFQFKPVTVDNQPAMSQSEWTRKLERAYRLFSYAWAIADDGCEVDSIRIDTSEMPSTDRAAQLKITRTFNSSQSDCSNEVSALCDLYPFRITEIAGLGRIFAAACALLQVYLERKETGKEKLSGIVLELLKDLHQEKRCQRLNQHYGLNSKSRLLNDQNRYNGCFSNQFDNCQKIIISKLKRLKLTQSYSEDFIENYRNELLSEIFEALHS